MPILKSVKVWVNVFVKFLQNILVPEDKKIETLLKLDLGTMRLLLPKSPVNMDDIYVLFDYGNKIVKTLVKSIKYKNNANLRKRIAKYLYEEVIDISEEIALFHSSPPLIVPMPMSKKEKRKRGFNQCEELLKEIEKLAGGNIEISYSTLKKIRETERQTKLSKEERLLNVKDSMRAFLKSEREPSFNSEIKNKTVIVLDDVYTTLASFSEARRALLASGARHVYGLFIAH